MTRKEKIRDLITEYIGSVKKIDNKLKQIECEISSLSLDDPDYDLKKHYLEHVKSDLKYFLSNLQYSLTWMKTGYAPDGKGI
jgi:hypothetical protein